MEFPQEMLEMVIDHLHRDKPSLCACSLASRCCLSATRYHLFGTIYFNRTMRHPDRFTTLLDSPLTTIPDSVTCLSLYTPITTSFRPYLQKFTRITKLILFSVQFGTLPEFIEFISNFPALTDISLVESPKMIRELEQDPPPPPSLHRLTITNPAQKPKNLDDPFLDWLLSLGLPQTFTHAFVTYHFTYTYHKDTQALTIRLWPNLSAQHLLLETVMRCLTSPVERVSVNFSEHGPDCVSGVDWEGMADFLGQVDAYGDGLTGVEFTSTRGSDMVAVPTTVEDAIKMKLWAFHNRGLLHFRCRS